MKHLLLILPLLCSCSPDASFIDYVETCVYTQFIADYPDVTYLTMETKESDQYYLTDVYYYDANIYDIKYISVVNDNNELIVKEVVCHYQS